MGNFNREVKITDKKFIESMRVLFFASLVQDLKDEISEGFFNICETGIVSSSSVHNVYIYIHYHETGQIPFTKIDTAVLYCIRKTLNQYFCFYMKELEDGKIESFVIDRREYEKLIEELKSMDEK